MLSEGLAFEETSEGHSQLVNVEWHPTCPQAESEAPEQAVRFNDAGVWVEWLVRSFTSPLYTPACKNNPEAARDAIASKVVAIVHAINPQVVGGESLESLAQRIGTTKQNLSRICAQFRAEFPVKNRLFRTDAQRQTMREAQLKGHWRKKKNPPVTAGAMNNNRGLASLEEGGNVNIAGGAAE